MSTRSYLRLLASAGVAVLLGSCGSDTTGPAQAALQPRDSGTVILPRASHNSIESLITIANQGGSQDDPGSPSFTLSVPDSVTLPYTLDETITFGGTNAFAPLVAVNYGDGGGAVSLSVSGGYTNGLVNHGGVYVDTTFFTPYTVTLDHAYQTVGAHTVTMATSNTNGTHVESGTLTASFPTDNSHPPQLTMTGDTTAVEGQSYSLIAAIADPDPAGTYSMVMNWGDGTTETRATQKDKIETFTHTWQAPGTYHISMIASDGIEKDTTAADFTVTQGSGPVIQILRGDSTAVASTLDTTVPYYFSFDWTDRDAPEDYTVSLNWGDGSITHRTTSDTTTFAWAHGYTALGTDTITIIVSDGGGADTLTHVVDVNDRPFTVVTDSSIISPDGKIYAGVPVGFIVHIDDPDSTGDYSIFLDWGDGTTELRPTQNEQKETFLHTYKTEGTDSLRAIFSDGSWADTLAQELTVLPSPCGPGTYIGSDGSCVPAPAGTYTDAAGATQATPCAPGTFQPQTGQTSCLPAPVGRFVATDSATTSTPCAPGTFEAQTGATKCDLAQPGEFVAIAGASSATPCAPGTFQANSGATSCEQAPAGSFVATQGASSATPCPAGSYQSQSGQTSCVTADPGHFVAQPGAIAESACAMGTFASGSGATQCEPAPVGTFVATVGSTSATPCAVGTYQDQAGQSSCKPAPAGTFVSVTGAATATPCVVGTYQPQTGQSSCIPAEPGSYVSISGAVATTPCPVGTYQPSTGQTSCIPAPVGSYVDVVGATEATVCPSGTTTLATGSTAVSDCITYGQVAQDRIQQAVSAGTIYPVAGGKGGQQTFDHWVSDLQRSSRFLAGPQHQAGCVGVRNLYLRADGKPSPKDAITGPGRADVAATLVWLMQKESCGS